MRKTLILHDNQYKKYIPSSPYIKGVEYPQKALSSNTSDSTFIVSTSSEFSSDYQAYKAFNKNNAGGTDRFVTKNNVLSGWLKVQLSPALKFSDYTIEAPNVAEVVTGMIKDWVLEGSNDNATWESLDTQSQTGWKIAEARSFKIESPKMFSYYRINFTSNNGLASNSQFGELRFYTEGTDEVFAEWSTVSSSLPTQEQFLSNGMDSLSPLLDRKITTLDPLPMTDKSEILFQNGKLFTKTIDLNKYMDIRSINAEVK